MSGVPTTAAHRRAYRPPERGGWDGAAGRAREGRALELFQRLGEVISVDQHHPHKLQMTYLFSL
jgi:hypothetical protein